MWKGENLCYEDRYDSNAMKWEYFSDMGKWHHRSGIFLRRFSYASCWWKTWTISYSFCILQLVGDLSPQNTSKLWLNSGAGQALKCQSAAYGYFSCALRMPMLIVRASFCPLELFSTRGAGEHWGGGGSKLVLKWGGGSRVMPCGSVAEKEDISGREDCWGFSAGGISLFCLPLCLCLTYWWLQL